MVKDLIDQINALKLLKKLGTTTKYIRPDLGSYKLSILVLAEASRKNDQGQLQFLSGLIFGDLVAGAVFHLISKSSHKSRRAAKSIASAEIIDSGEVIEKEKVIEKAFNDLIGLNLDLWVSVDSKDSFSSLHTFRFATDMSIRGNVS